MIININAWKNTGNQEVLQATTIDNADGQWTRIKLLSAQGSYPILSGVGTMQPNVEYDISAKTSVYLSASTNLANLVAKLEIW